MNERRKNQNEYIKYLRDINRNKLHQILLKSCTMSIFEEREDKKEKKKKNEGTSEVE